MMPTRNLCHACGRPKLGGEKQVLIDGRLLRARECRMCGALSTQGTREHAPRVVGSVARGCLPAPRAA